MFTEHTFHALWFFYVLKLHVICFPAFAFVGSVLKVLMFELLARMCNSYEFSSFAIDPLIGRFLPSY